VVATGEWIPPPEFATPPDSPTYGCAFAQKRRPAAATLRPLKAGEQTRGRSMKNLKKFAIFCLLSFAAAVNADARFL
jgi:hypothetical protein